MSLVQSQSLTPDAVFGPNGEDMPMVKVAEVWAALDPCPSCGSRPHESPEGYDQFSDTPAWDNPHCWRCGFRASSDPTDDMRRKEMFAAFQEFYAEKTRQDMSHPTLNAPASDNEAAQLRQQVLQLQEQLASRGPNVDPTSSAPMGTTGATPEPVPSTPASAFPGAGTAAPVSQTPAAPSPSIPWPEAAPSNVNTTPMTDVAAEPVVPSQPTMPDSGTPAADTADKPNPTNPA